MDEDINMLCECNSEDCTLTTKIPKTKAVEIIANDYWAFIVDGCKKGPERSDVLLSTGIGYKIYTTARSMK